MNRRNTLNAGKALYHGVEFELSGTYKLFDYGGSLTFSRNRWKKMNVKAIFEVPSEDVVGKVVPFSPERMASLNLGYHFTVHRDHHYRMGIRFNYWDEYYGTYSNNYIKEDGTVEDAKLPMFLDISVQMSFTKSLPNADLIFRIDANNLLNRKDNYMRAQYTIDYTRNDFLAGKYHWYVLQAPLLNIFLTAEVAIH